MFIKNINPICACYACNLCIFFLSMLCAFGQNKCPSSSNISDEGLNSKAKEKEHIFYIESLIIGVSDILEHREKVDKITVKITEFEEIAERSNIPSILNKYKDNDKNSALKNYLASIFLNKQQSMEDLAIELFTAFVNFKKGLFSKSFDLNFYKHEILHNITQQDNIDAWNTRIKDPLQFYFSHAPDVKLNDDLCRRYAKLFESYFISQDKTTLKLSQEDINRLFLINSALETFLDKKGLQSIDQLGDLSDWLCGYKSLHESFFSHLGIENEQSYKDLTEAFVKVFTIP